MKNKKQSDSPIGVLTVSDLTPEQTEEFKIEWNKAMKDNTN